MDSQFEEHRLKPEFDRVIDLIGKNGVEITDLEKVMQTTRESPQARAPAMIGRLSEPNDFLYVFNH